MHKEVEVGATGLGIFPGFVGVDYDGLFCQHGPVFIRFPVSLETYNVKALRSVYDIVADSPPGLSATFITEAFSTHGEKSVPANSTAYPDRENNLLLSPFITYSPKLDLEEEAMALGQRMQSILVKASGKKLNSYVNYALGYESLQELYGYEEWRVEKLKALKKAYDPLGKFNYYAPIR